MILDLDDQFRSVYRMLWTLYGVQRRAGMRVEQTISREVDRGSGIYEDQAQYAITYYGTGRGDCLKTSGLLRQYLENGGEDYSNRYLIPAWKFGWNFPQPLDIELSAGGTIPQGNHLVRISGIDVCGNESAASEGINVTVDGTQGLSITIPRVPWNHPLFPEYNVSVDGHLETANVLMPTWGYPLATVNSLTGTGPAPPEAQTSQGDLNAVRWKFLRVTMMNSTLREDPIENGV